MCVGWHHSQGPHCLETLAPDDIYSHTSGLCLDERHQESVKGRHCDPASIARHLTAHALDRGTCRSATTDPSPCDLIQQERQIATVVTTPNRRLTFLVTVSQVPSLKEVADLPKHSQVALLTEVVGPPKRGYSAWEQPQQPPERKTRSKSAGPKRSHWNASIETWENCELHLQAITPMTSCY